LCVLDPFLAISAIGGGIGLLVGAADLPQEWLDDTPFASYAIPGIILAVVVGGAWLIASLALYSRYRFAPFASLLAGTLQLGWFAVQVAMLGYISWMQPFIGALAVIVIVAAWRWQRALATDEM
jgi:hypothetical protein